MSPCLFTCTRLTGACRTAGLLNRARHWANGLFKNGIVPDGGVHNHISHGCGSQNGDPQSWTAGTHELAWKSFGEFYPSVPPTTRGSACAATGDSERANTWSSTPGKASSLTHDRTTSPRTRHMPGRGSIRGVLKRPDGRRQHVALPLDLHSSDLCRQRCKLD